jgi:flagellar hook-basal body complex protein FliE
MDEIRMPSVGSISPTGAAGPAGGAGRGGVPAGPGFSDSLKDAIAKVNTVQLEANQAVEQLMTGQSQNVHQTMIALQKADVSFQLMMQVRNKIAAAYEEIQRMQI